MSDPQFRGVGENDEDVPRQAPSINPEEPEEFLKIRHLYSEYQATLNELTETESSLTSEFEEAKQNSFEYWQSILSAVTRRIDDISARAVLGEVDIDASEMRTLISVRDKLRDVLRDGEVTSEEADILDFLADLPLPQEIKKKLRRSDQLILVRDKIAHIKKKMAELEPSMRAMAEFHEKIERLAKEPMPVRLVDEETIEADLEPMMKLVDMEEDVSRRRAERDVAVREMRLAWQLLREVGAELSRFEVEKEGDSPGQKVEKMLARLQLIARREQAMRVIKKFYSRSPQKTVGILDHVELLRAQGEIFTEKQIEEYLFCELEDALACGQAEDAKKILSRLIKKDKKGREVMATMDLTTARRILDAYTVGASSLPVLSDFGILEEELKIVCSKDKDLVLRWQEIGQQRALGCLAVGKFADARKAAKTNKSEVVAIVSHLIGSAEPGVIEKLNEICRLVLGERKIFLSAYNQRTDLGLSVKELIELYKFGLSEYLEGANVSQKGIIVRMDPFFYLFEDVTREDDKVTDFKRILQSAYEKRAEKGDALVARRIKIVSRVMGVVLLTPKHIAAMLEAKDKLLQGEITAEERDDLLWQREMFKKVDKELNAGNWEALSCLAGVDLPEAWEWRQMFWHFFDKEENAGLVSTSLAGIDSEQAWQWRKQMGDPLELLTLVGLDSDRSWEIRERAVERARYKLSYDVSLSIRTMLLATLAGLESERARGMREKLIGGDIGMWERDKIGLPDSDTFDEESTLDTVGADDPRRKLPSAFEKYGTPTEKRLRGGWIAVALRKARADKLKTIREREEVARIRAEIEARVKDSREREKEIAAALEEMRYQRSNPRSKLQDVVSRHETILDAEREIATDLSSKLTTRARMFGLDEKYSFTGPEQLSGNITREHIKAISSVLYDADVDLFYLPTLAELGDLSGSYIRMMYPETAREEDVQAGLVAERPSHWTRAAPKDLQDDSGTRTRSDVYIDFMRKQLSEIGGRLMLISPLRFGFDALGAIVGLVKDKSIPQQYFLESGVLLKIINKKFLPQIKERICNIFQSRGLAAVDFDVILLPSICYPLYSLYRPEISKLGQDLTSTIMQVAGSRQKQYDLVAGGGSLGGASALSHIPVQTDLSHALEYGFRIAIVFKK